jgi:hypothetical protein
MTTAHVSAPLVLEAAAAAPGRQAAVAQAAPLGQLLPDDVRTWLARARLLEGVPFQHLVADADLLPPESIRFFYVDREWTDAMTQGALSVGTITSQDRIALQALHARLRDEVDTEERRVRAVGGESVPVAPAGTITGFLLRSRAVSGWPGLHVRAYRTDFGPDNGPLPTEDQRVRLVRLERLAPAVLLCLFDGVPAVIHLEEPRSGVQYGVDLAPGPDGTLRPVVHLRDVRTAERLPDSSMNPALVMMRQGGRGVIDMNSLTKYISIVGGTHTDTADDEGVSSAEMAIELLQFPFRQVFGPTHAVAADPVPFRPQIALETVQEWSAEAPE